MTKAKTNADPKTKRSASKFLTELVESIAREQKESAKRKKIMTRMVKDLRKATELHGG